MADEDIQQAVDSDESVLLIGPHCDSDNCEEIKIGLINPSICEDEGTGRSVAFIELPAVEMLKIASELLALVYHQLVCTEDDEDEESTES